MLISEINYCKLLTLDMIDSDTMCNSTLGLANLQSGPDQGHPSPLPPEMK